MSTAWTIRCRRNASAVRRPASLSSLPDLSDELEIGSRPGSGASGLFESWGQNPISSNTYDSQSNISVSFLGSRIRRQYRSAFLLSDEHVVGVSRCETFHPEVAKADVRINLSVQGPPNESVIPGHRRSQSAPSLIRDNLDENRGWARLMLTTDRPRGSEILGRSGSRNYFAKVGINSPYFHRRIKPMKKEEEYIIGVSTLRGNAESEEKNGSVSATLVSGTASDGEPSIDRFEKETYLDTARRLGSPVTVANCAAISHLSRVSLRDNNESQSPIPEAPTSSTNLLSPENLPSTERSESILHLKRSKSESSLSARTLNLVGTPWNKLILQKSPVELSPEPAPESPTREATTPHIDNTLSLQTDLEDDDEVENVQESRTEKYGISSPGSLFKVQNPEDSVTAASVLSFVSATNGVVIHLGGPDGQECISSYYGQSPMKSTILYTTLQNNIGPVISQGSDGSTKIHGSNEIEETNGCITSEDFEIMMAKDVEDTENDFRSPLPKERKRMSIEQEKLSDDVWHRRLFMLLGKMVLYP
ncbi:unnamed protein product [Hymenolepis diminuta]|uniref:Pecanex-like protein n=1 Tax=Hymenolepis diminuta TaxID=6216 RepID=A0A0R3SD72_HYMDI|nr:unnamed protein product [Hymenolepis diminuta]